MEEYENIQAQRGMKKSKSNRVGTRDGTASKEMMNKAKLKAKVAKTDSLFSVSIRDAGHVTSEGTSRKADVTTAQCTTLPETKVVKGLSFITSRTPTDSSGEEYDFERWSKVSGATQVPMSPSKRKVKSIVVASCSDSDSQRIKKSPRKMVKNKLPGRKRPASPTPGVSRSTQTKTYDKVIEVSSDSDSDGSLPSRITLPPLMAARARATTNKSIQDTILLKSHKQTVHATPSKIIDLT